MKEHKTVMRKKKRELRLFTSDTNGHWEILLIFVNTATCYILSYELLGIMMGSTGMKITLSPSRTPIVKFPYTPKCLLSAYQPYSFKRHKTG
jgi:hypothetical protein